MIYNFLSLTFNRRFCLQINFSEKGYIFSLTFLFNALNWLEREVYDMFGIFFINHKNLKRILTDYGFNAYPLRKDFPCSGFFELNYSSSYYKLRKFKMFSSFLH